MSVSDNLPELQENFAVVLVSAVASEGQDSTPLSGASIDPLTAVSNISIVENDLPNGLLQFSATGRILEDEEQIIPVLEFQPEVKSYQLPL